jgi:glycosyltransferase involved in cell wall biosynthesis
LRIAFIGTRGVPASYSGFETCVEQVGRRMVERGHDVTVFCRTGHYRERLKSHLGMKLVYLPALREKHLETLSHTALSALKLPRDTAVVCMGVGNAPVVRLLEIRGRRTAFNVDGTDWQRKKWGRFARWYLHRCESMAARGGSFIVADAKAVEDYYSEHYARKTEPIAYGADPPADTGTATLEKFGLEPRRYLLWVGRLVPENGAGDYLEAVRLAGLDAPAVVVGDADYAGEHKAELHAEAPANTVFTGYQFGSAYQQLSAHAGLYILAASIGGTHPVLVEQMAAGNAILARETASNSEVLGDAGLYWKTPQELAELLKSTWPDTKRRRQLGDAARSRARELYSWDEVTSRYLELCERSLKGGSTTSR